MTDEKKAAIYLRTAALGFASAVAHAPDDYVGAGDFLSTTALAYAAAAGNLAAGERAEIDALRRFRDGVVSLRGELTAGKAIDGKPATRELVIETVDALISTSYPPIGVQP